MTISSFPNNRAIMALLTFIAVIVFLNNRSGVRTQTKIDALKHQERVMHAEQQIKLAQQIYEDTRVDQEDCERELNDKSALVSLGEIQGLFERDIKIAGEGTKIKIHAVLEPYRECLERRAKARQQKYKPSHPLTPKDI